MPSYYRLRRKDSARAARTAWVLVVWCLHFGDKNVELYPAKAITTVVEAPWAWVFHALGGSLWSETIHQQCGTFGGGAGCLVVVQFVWLHYGHLPTPPWPE